MLVAAFFVCAVLGQAFVIGAACVFFAWVGAGQLTAKVYRGKRDGIWCEGFDDGKEKQRKLVLTKLHHDVEDHGYTWVRWDWPDRPLYADEAVARSDWFSQAGYARRAEVKVQRMLNEPPAVFDHQGR